MSLVEAKQSPPGQRMLSGHGINQDAVSAGDAVAPRVPGHGCWRRSVNFTQRCYMMWYSVWFLFMSLVGSAVWLLVSDPCKMSCSRDSSESGDWKSGELLTTLQKPAALWLSVVLCWDCDYPPLPFSRLWGKLLQHLGQLPLQKLWWRLLPFPVRLQLRPHQPLCARLQGL